MGPIEGGDVQSSLLTMWNVNLKLSRQIMTQRFFINYVECKYANDWLYSLLLHRFFINYVECKLLSFRRHGRHGRTFFINYVECKVLFGD